MRLLKENANYASSTLLINCKFHVMKIMAMDKSKDHYTGRRKKLGPILNKANLRRKLL